MSVGFTSSPRERGIFLGALERTGSAERAAFLAAACGADQALRQHVEELVHEHEEIGGFLETPAVARPADADPAVAGRDNELWSAASAERPGGWIGPYCQRRNETT